MKTLFFFRSLTFEEHVFTIMEFDFIIVNTNSSSSYIIKKLGNDMKEIDKKEFYKNFFDSINKDNLARYVGSGDLYKKRLLKIEHILEEENFSEEINLRVLLENLDIIRFTITNIFDNYKVFILGVSTGQISLQKFLFDINLIGVIKDFFT